MSRYRSKLRSSPRGIASAPAVGVTGPIGPCINSWGGALSTQYSRTETMTDELATGGYRSWHPVNHVIKEYANCHGTMVYTYPSTQPCVCTFDSFFLAPAAWAPPDPPSVDWASLINGLADQVSGSCDEGSMFFVTLAEAQKTIRMIRNPFNLLRTNWRKLCRRETALSLHKKAANVWLEGQYGWNSFWYDVKASIKTYAKLKELATVRSLRGSLIRLSEGDESSGSLGGDWTYDSLSGNEAGWNYYVSSGFNTQPSSGGFGRVRWLDYQLKARIGCMQDLRVADRMNRTEQLFGAVSLDTPGMLASIWELIPMSFVIDWFVDFQGIWTLPNALRLSYGRDVRDLGTSLKVTSTFEAEMLKGRNPYYYLQASNPWYWLNANGWHSPVFKGKGKYVSYVRTYGLPSYDLIYSSFLANGLSTLQSISGAALAIQKVFKPRRTGRAH